MKLVTVTARETFPYADLTRYSGMSFTATEEDALILVMAGRVTLGGPAKDAEAVSEQLAEAPVVRRRSRRKDIVPEP